ncbi:winged helix-turn-helix transcriptional regulator [Streptomyces sp. NPDC059582]|uniref:winged helix-turn-helix transcriptional regulator n=1 Tax=Streptomyces sp. NPDC059582 TaxID=3346875 RepID=UPI0036C00C1B
MLGRRRRSPARSPTPLPCSVADAAPLLGRRRVALLVGEKYSLLVPREVLLGNGRSDRLVRDIDAPRDLPASRPRRLVDAGIQTRRAYREHPQRFDHRPAHAGTEPKGVLMTLMAWGDRHPRADDDRPLMIEHLRGDELVAGVTCAAGGDELRHEDLTAHPQAPDWTVSGPTAA